MKVSRIVFTITSDNSVLDFGTNNNFVRTSFTQQKKRFGG